MNYNHYSGMCIPGCRRYLVEYEIQFKNNTEIGKTNVMACSRQHAIFLVRKELESYDYYEGIKKILRAWLEDDGFPTDNPNPYPHNIINTTLPDSPL